MHTMRIIRIFEKAKQLILTVFVEPRISKFDNISLIRRDPSTKTEINVFYVSPLQTFHV